MAMEDLGDGHRLGVSSEAAIRTGSKTVRLEHHEEGMGQGPSRWLCRPGNRSSGFILRAMGSEEVPKSGILLTFQRSPCREENVLQNVSGDSSGLGPGGLG